MKALDRRLKQFEQLKTEKEIRQHQQKLKSFFRTQLGGFPEKTPLNSTTTKTIQADGYTIENVIFASRPNHHITANFYLPGGKGPFPCVIVSSGHSRTAKTADYNQRFGIAMAKHGMAALCFDPIGQGERSQILNESGKNMYSSTTREHFFIGVGSILVGRNTATYPDLGWNASNRLRGVVVRKSMRIGIGYTGCSGGGTLTSYVMALDDRVTCAAPACYLTTWRRLIETIGPQDSEQNIFGQVAFGLDHPDYVLMRAPKPTLISSTTQDFFRYPWFMEQFAASETHLCAVGIPRTSRLGRSRREAWCAIAKPGDHYILDETLASQNRPTGKKNGFENSTSGRTAVHKVWPGIEFAR